MSQLFVIDIDQVCVAKTSDLPWINHFLKAIRDIICSLNENAFNLHGYVWNAHITHDPMPFEF